MVGSVPCSALGCRPSQDGDRVLVPGVLDRQDLRLEALTSLGLECAGGGSGSSMEGDWDDHRHPRTRCWSDERVECGEVVTLFSCCWIEMFRSVRLSRVVARLVHLSSLCDRCRHDDGSSARRRPRIPRPVVSVRFRVSSVISDVFGKTELAIIGCGWRGGANRGSRGEVWG